MTARSIHPTCTLDAERTQRKLERLLPVIARLLGDRWWTAPDLIGLADGRHGSQEEKDRVTRFLAPITKSAADRWGDIEDEVLIDEIELIFDAHVEDGGPAPVSIPGFTIYRKRGYAVGLQGFRVVADDKGIQP